MGYLEYDRAQMAVERFRSGNWVYLQAEDFEFDEAGGRRTCRKILHIAVTADTGRTVDVDFTPYADITPETFEQLIALDFPGRQGLGPLDAAEVDALAREVA